MVSPWRRAVLMVSRYGVPVVPLWCLVGVSDVSMLIPGCPRVLVASWYVVLAVPRQLLVIGWLRLDGLSLRVTQVLRLFLLTPQVRPRGIW